MSGFSEKLKAKVRQKSLFRCVICHQPFVEVHHIIPQEENGPDTEDNAAPLCAGCHDLYGDNPSKRKQIKEMRDDWYQIVENLKKDADKIIKEIEIIPSQNVMRSKNKIALYHVVFEWENFETAAKMLFEIVKNAQQQCPNAERCLFLDIDGHRNSKGGFDQDMFELQSKFLLEVLMPFLTEASTPLGKIVNKNQKNDIPDLLNI